MQFSTRGRYGLRAMADLALHAPDGPLALRVIAERQDLSESYLEQVFSSLRKAGLVKSSRGAQGGYELSRPAAEITIAEILTALEGPITPISCVDVTRQHQCERENICITRPFWEEFQCKVNDYLTGTTLQDLLDKAPKNEKEPPMYYI